MHPLRFVLTRGCCSRCGGARLNVTMPDTCNVGTVSVHSTTHRGLYVNRSTDFDTEEKYYDLLAGYAMHYLADGARSLGFGGAPADPHIGGGVLYWNESLSLLWNPNLEHSRLGSYWSCYDQLTNSFAVEGLRALAAAATRLGRDADATKWSAIRARILHGINTMLTAEPLSSRTAGGGSTAHSAESKTSVYAELRGHPNSFSEDKGRVGYSPLLWGTSYENIVPGVIALSAMGSNSSNATEAASALGLDVGRLDRTWAEYRRAGSFQWLNPTHEYSAYILTTHVNSSGWLDYPTALPRPPAPPPPKPTKCSPQSWLSGAKALELGHGPDICNPKDRDAACQNITDAAGCCAACAASRQPQISSREMFPSAAEQEGEKGCAAWFFNGASTDCNGHGCCYMKSSADADKVTPPDPRFAAGIGPGDPVADAGICSYTGDYRDPPARACPAPGGKTCPCASYSAIGKSIGWELGWAAFRGGFTRLISLHRWLGQAAHVEQTTLFGESYVYDCIKEGEASGFQPFTPKNPRGAGCWGDPGNGVQIGWFLWGEALARAAAGLPTT